MKQLLKKLVLLVQLMLVGQQAFSYDFEVNGIYYGYDSNNQSAYVTYNNSQKYTGEILIPASISYNGRTISVTAIGNNAFRNCTELNSVIIPNSIITIEADAFHSCSNLSSLAIPSSVRRIESGALMGMVLDKLIFEDGDNILSFNYYNNAARFIYLGRDLLSEVVMTSDKLDILTISQQVKEVPYENVNKVIYCMSNQPNQIKCKFNNNTYLHTQLYVPTGTKDEFLVAEGWKNFFNIQEMDVDKMWNGQGEPPTGDNPQQPKCEKPSIHYSKGKILFECATDGASFQSTISDADIASYNEQEIQLSVTYNISVYATASGYENSEVATATLCWIDVEPKTEGIEDGISQVRANAILIQSNNGTLNISGANKGTNIDIYTTSGVMVGSAKASSSPTAINTGLKNGEIAIVKIGDKSVKVVMK